MSPELGVVKIASPCPAKWSRMKGTDRVRFCNQCQLKVYDLTRLDADEARALLEAHEGRRICVRFYTRRDGRVMTRDCGLASKLRARWVGVTGLLGIVTAAALLFVTVVTLFGDNIRRAFGMSAGGLSSYEEPPPEPVNPRKPTRPFGENNSY